MPLVRASQARPRTTSSRCPRPPGRTAPRPRRHLRTPPHLVHGGEVPPLTCPPRASVDRGKAARRSTEHGGGAGGSGRRQLPSRPWSIAVGTARRPQQAVRHADSNRGRRDRAKRREWSTASRHERPGDTAGRFRDALQLHGRVQELAGQRRDTQLWGPHVRECASSVSEVGSSPSSTSGSGNVPAWSSARCSGSEKIASRSTRWSSSAAAWTARGRRHRPARGSRPRPNRFVIARNGRSSSSTPTPSGGDRSHRTGCRRRRLP